jgi:hypothetical protein
MVEVGNAAAADSVSALKGTGVLKAGVPVAPADSVRADTIVDTSVTARGYGVVFDGAERVSHRGTVHRTEGVDASWVLMLLLLLFMAVGVKAGKSRKYFQILVRDLTDTRRRNNIFDDTVRETSFLIILNVLSLASLGVILFYGIGGLEMVAKGADVTLGLLICIGVSLAYGFLMWCTYWVSGVVFSDKTTTRIWVRGFAAAQALLGVALLPIALAMMFYPICCQELLFCAFSLFVISKIIFLCKGFRIFSHQPSSYLLFLYYLCTVELIPLIIVYIGARFLCLMLL